MKDLQKDLQKAANYVMDMVHLDADPSTPTPLLDRLKVAPGRLKTLLKDTMVECVKNTFTLLASHFSKLALEHTMTGVTADFEEYMISEVVENYHDVAETITNDLDL